ncbi:MAG: TetR/AcrR family transcriptional regulator [Peptococcaceae bacterium]|nr:TetR/AcrR family transcriptional regulator [Peptococcaceae bacterium]NLP38034.1 TetR/AcrR family transcriptional regulator [Bacillota bacterium]
MATEKFMKLDPQKRKTILDAALQEFADYGYEYASTNRIVEKAKISKGSLFYYFKSKKELYYYLINYGIEYVEKHYLPKVDEKETDLIEKFRKTAKIKLRSYSEIPGIFNFLGEVYINEFESLPEDLKQRLLEMRNLAYTKLFKNIDTGLFREDMEPNEVIRLFSLTLSGYEKELVNRFKGKQISALNYEAYWQEYDEFLDLLKKAYYKSK